LIINAFISVKTAVALVTAVFFDFIRWIQEHCEVLQANWFSFLTGFIAGFIHFIACFYV
jgi:hypothetical protein